MRKLKVYLDTSVISHLIAPDVPEKMSDTRELWKSIKSDNYKAVISGTTITELASCPEPKRSALFDELRETPYVLLPEIADVEMLARAYISAGVLTQKSIDDCFHLAYSSVYDCDVIVSWNFKHIVNYRTMTGVKGVNALNGYKEIVICTPTILIEGGA